MSKEITEGKRAPASPAPTKGKDPKPKRRTEKERLQERLRALGVDVTGMTKVKLRSELERIKSGGQSVPDLRQGNSAPESLSKSPKVLETREQHLFGEVEITVTDGSGTTRKEKKTRLVAILDTLAIEAIKNKDVGAAREYFDRTLGKAKQEIEYNDPDIEEQRLPTKAEKAAAKAYLEALEDDDDE